jgi:glycopeptide antibiotics resistance protein
MQNKNISKLLQLVFTTSYFTILFYLVFFLGRRKDAYSYGINLVPLLNTLREYKFIAAIGRFNYFSNIFGNILLFIPFPIILKTVFRVTRLLYLLSFSILLSFMIELFQYIFRVGVADIDDIILNTVGAFVGCVLISLFNNTPAPVIL